MSRLTPGTVIVGIFAVLFGLIGAYGVRKYLQGDVAKAPEPPAPRQQVVPLASMDIAAGREVVLGEVALLNLTPQQISKMQADNKLPSQYMGNPQQIIGRTLKRAKKQADAFLPDDFYPEGTGPTVAEKLAPGLRAVTIPVEGTGALGGYDGVGSYVDIVFRSIADEAAGIPETTVTLLEGVQVLAMESVAARTPPGTSLENRVTLAVTAMQANALKIAEGRGTFSLSLRNAEDVEIAGASAPQTLDRLLNVPVREDYVTAIYRGGNGAAQSNSFAGPTLVSQPAVALPIAGVLQMRAAQQTTSVERPAPQANGAEDAASEPAAHAAPPAPEAESSRPIETSSPASGPDPDKAANAASAQPPATTAVSARIPVSVQVRQAAPTANAQETLATGDAEPGQNVTATPPADDSARDSRPRKLLSDIGRQYWDK